MSLVLNCIFIIKLEGQSILRANHQLRDPQKQNMKIAFVYIVNTQ